MEFEAPDYSLEGVAAFKRDIIENEVFIQNCRHGICPIYAAFDNDLMIGIIGMRRTKTHINILFVKKEYHRRGVATALFEHLLNEVLVDDPALMEITLNSSPYGKPFYLHIGFEPTAEEQEIDGIRFTPMKYTVI